jgi:hypothetical protein
LKEREEPIGNATINTLFAALSAAYSYFIEQGWCSENPLKFIRDLEVAMTSATASGPDVSNPPSSQRSRYSTNASATVPSEIMNSPIRRAMLIRVDWFEGSAASSCASCTDVTRLIAS